MEDIEIINFNELPVKAIPDQADTLILVDNKTNEALRTTVSAIAVRGADGASVEVQYSQDGFSWHDVMLSTDVWMRQRVGNAAWSDSLQMRLTEQERYNEVQDQIDKNIKNAIKDIEIQINSATENKLEVAQNNDQILDIIYFDDQTASGIFMLSNVAVKITTGIIVTAPAKFEVFATKEIITQELTFIYSGLQRFFRTGAAKPGPKGAIYWSWSDWES